MQRWRKRTSRPQHLQNLSNYRVHRLSIITSTCTFLFYSRHTTVIREGFGAESAQWADALFDGYIGHCATVAVDPNGTSLCSPLGGESSSQQVSLHFFHPRIFFLHLLPLDDEPRSTFMSFCSFPLCGSQGKISRISEPWKQLCSTFYTGFFSTLLKNVPKLILMLALYQIRFIIYFLFPPWRWVFEFHKARNVGKRTAWNCFRWNQFRAILSQLFVYLFAPLSNHLKDIDFKTNLRLENGVKIWYPMSEFRHPNAACFAAHCRPKPRVLWTRSTKITKPQPGPPDVFAGSSE